MMMPLHESTFEYLKPTDEQMETMVKCRASFRMLFGALDELIPDGPDKTYLIRELRSAAMWANVAITRQPDGSPRT